MTSTHHTRSVLGKKLLMLLVLLIIFLAGVRIVFWSPTDLRQTSTWISESFMRKGSQIFRRYQPRGIMSKIAMPPEYTLTENRSTNSYILKAPISGNVSLTMKLLSEMADAARTNMIRNFKKYHRFSLSLQSPNTTGRKKLLVLNDHPDKKTEMVHQFRHLISLMLLWNSDPSVMNNTRQNTMNTVYDLSLARTYHD